VKKLAIKSGVRGAKEINFSSHLGSARDKVYRTPDGWELSDAGRQYVAEIAAHVAAVLLLDHLRRRAALHAIALIFSPAVNARWILEHGNLR
jgi:hypothetical protein